MFNMFQSSEENLRRKISANQEGKKILRFQKSEGSFNILQAHAKPANIDLEAPRKRYCRKRTSSCHSQAAASANHLDCMDCIDCIDCIAVVAVTTLTSNDFQSSLSLVPSGNTIRSFTCLLHLPGLQQICQT